MWRRLYPEGADPEYRVYREHLAGALYEYYAEVIYTTVPILALALTPVWCYRGSCRLALQRGSHANPPRFLLLPVSARERAYSLPFYGSGVRSSC